MLSHRSTDAETRRALRPHWSERALVFATPAAFAAAFGALGGAAGGAAAGLLGAGLGVGLATLAQRRATERLDLVEAAAARAADEARADLRGQFAALVDEAARTGAEFERRAVYAEDARRAQNRLLAELAPEFYGLLRSMGHHAEQLRSVELDPEDERAVEALCDGTASLRRLLGAVLDLARARAGRLRLRERDFDLTTVLERVGTAFSNAARTKGVEYRLALGRLSNHWRFGDERRVQQVLERVLSAALDTSERGAVELSVSEDAERPDRLVLEVTDTAPVHDQASFERLLTESPAGLENLFELDASLSLSLARGLVEVLGGALVAAARREGGHVVRIELPLPHGADPEAEEERASSDAVGLRTLVAAPEGADGDLVASTASGLGWLVERATDGEGAEQLLSEQGGADLIVVAADLDGGEGARRLAAWTAQWPGSTGVLLALGASIDPREVLESGARSVLTGPLHPARLRESLAALRLVGAGVAARPTRALLAVADDRLAEAERATLAAEGLVVDRVRCLDDLVEAFQDAVYGLVVVDSDLGEPAVRARIEAAVGLSAVPFKIRVVPSGHGVSQEPTSSVGSSSHPVTSPTVNDRREAVAVDREVLQSLRELGGEDEPNLLEELVALFVRDTPPRLAELRDAVERGDVEAAERVAHALKSSCGNLGAAGMAELCRAIEQSCRDGALDGVPSLVERSNDEYERVVRELTAELG